MAPLRDGTISDADDRRSLSDRSIQKSPSKRTSMATRIDLANRRRSVLREHHQQPLGPRPPDFSSKRLTSTSTLNSSQDAPHLPPITTEPLSIPSRKRNTSTFEGQRVQDGQDPYTSNHDRRPSISSAFTPTPSKQTTSFDAQLDNFPKPGGQRRQSAFNRADQSAVGEPTKFVPDPFDLGNHLAEEGNSEFGRAGIQQNGMVGQAAGSSSRSSSTNRTSMYNPTNGRRQSQMPPSSLSNVTSKQPRKSIGPGFSVPTARGRTVFDPPPTPGVPESSSNEVLKSSRVSQATLKPQGSVGVAPSSENVNPSSKPGSLKGLSLKTSPSQLQGTHAFLDLPPPTTSFTAQQDNRSPMRAATQHNPPPSASSSSKRQSTAVGHIGSLGARTVSPTDVRKSRRMSISNRPPPLPTRSPTPELSSDERALPTPPFNFLQHMMPTSPRGTPDVPQRKNSGRSSRSSYNSTRPASSSSQRRSSFTNFSARSPTIKSRNVPSSHGVETEIVPPVPAIPKAYESPSEVIDKPFFSDLGTTVHHGKTPLETDIRTSGERFMTPEEGHPDPMTGLPQHCQSRRLTLGARPEGVGDVPPLVINKHWIQGPRLPPINLLPLSTPTANKIASMARRSHEIDQDSSTPPPNKSGPKTPSTPMTASKATFPSYDFQHNFDLNNFPNFRSSTSYAAQKSETSTLNESGGSDSPAVVTPASPVPGVSRHGPSPFGSFSLPRPTGDMHQLTTQKAQGSGKDTNSHARKASKSLIRRPSNVSKTSKEQKDNTHAFTDTETSQTGSSLRRKLSIGWRRSSSKASHTSQHLEDDRAIPSASEMPPPKLPVSSSKNSFSRKSPKLPYSAISSQTDLGSTFGSGRPATNSNPDLSRSSQRQSSMKVDTSSSSSKSSHSLFSPMQRMLGSRTSSHNMKTQRPTAGLDRDDLAADEEMKKLGSKKKEFESSARELDELKKRAIAKERVSPSQAARIAALNIFEKGEIIDYKDEGVYFCGTKDAKKFVGDLAATNVNFGFDDERGDYNIVFGDHLAYRYEVIDLLGKGSFGQVVRCVDHKTGALVAIKIIRNKKRFHQQALVEVNILKKLREWDPDDSHSMINFTQCFYFRGHLCIATELLGINLYEFIKAHDFAGFSLKLIKRFTKQMLSSLCLLQNHNVIHCDLKPENILLSHPLRSEIKVIDFGSSCFDNERVYTYIQSRFYRSPEVILGMHYGMPIDMWSLGCILAELWTGFPIFPGENESEQLACIMEVFGPPEKHLIEKSTRKKVFFDSLGKPRVVVNNKGKRRRPSSKTLTQVLKSDDEAFVDFIAKCLRWDPDKRMKPHEATGHDFIIGMKKTARAKTQYGASVASPAKRNTVTQTPTKARNVPEPPVTSYKNGVPVSSRNSSTSPIKGSVGAARRKSTMQDQQLPPATRVTSNGLGSGLPRATTQRTASGKPDLASAAAAISLAGGAKNRMVTNGI